MDKRKLNRITWAFVAVTVLTVALMLTGSLRRTSRITLPSSTTASDTQPEDSTGSGDMPTVVTVTPETVQTAIETLDRPEAYRRTVTVEQFWGSGSGTYAVTVTVRGGWTRTDRTLPDGRVRHAATNGETTYIWYNSQNPVYTTSAGGVSADNEQTIPTYEDVLNLPVEEIVEADYRTISEVNCIYV